MYFLLVFEKTFLTCKTGVWSIVILNIKIYLTTLHVHMGALFKDFLLFLTLNIIDGVLIYSFVCWNLIYIQFEIGLLVAIVFFDLFSFCVFVSLVRPGTNQVNHIPFYI